MELVLFHSNFELTREILPYHTGPIIVDWEHRGKSVRQVDTDTQISVHTVKDLQQVRGLTSNLLICRVNGWNYGAADEIKQALDYGANEVILPMVQNLSQVEQALRVVDDHAKLGIMVETKWSVKYATQLAAYPLARAYFGLHDFAIETRCQNIFQPVADGTLARVKGVFNVPFGFAGLTHPDFGRPVECKLLMGEMIRLGCEFSFLRRSFYNALKHYSVDEVLQGINQCKTSLSKSIIPNSEINPELLRQISEFT